MKKKFLGVFLLFSIALVGCSSLSGSDDQTETQMEPQKIQKHRPVKAVLFWKNQKISL